ncbi:LysR family transcriptional regulator [Agarivorans sp. JK6]|uniref:LysR family transcriptional regulator n=1 Tax=Agarivorans sp. JK6 TaxID=2997426 RepID=UPI003873037B
MSVSFEQLKSMVVFAQVVEQGSFSAAAKHIGITRAVVSYHIKKLEQQLGLSLLNRSTRSLHLTEAGEQYYQRCHNIAEQAKAANLQIENLKQEPEGSIKISCPVNAGLQTIVPVINEFRRLYPKVNIELVLSDEVVNIIQDGFDLAIRGAELNDSGLQAAKLTTLSTCLCAAPEYLNKHGRPTKPADLDAHQWVIYTAGSSTLQLSKGSRSFSIKTKGGMSTNNAAVRTAFVEGGHGLGRVPLYDALPKIQAGKLEVLMADYQLQDIDVYCVFPKGSASSKKLRLLIDYLKQSLAKQESLRAR